ncbi:cyanophycinase [Duganella callida]|uniref:Cyanophycinase n=1 Tax=Duganella callida TaxID=2561932 RepID=A0A4Y9T004_9BURK|nr:cyanophycinase [Duganella callida]TFW31163.1 cyanophycinase [Duganella callida]
MGTLMIIGGAEDRTDNMEVLKRFIALSGGRDQPLVVITAASTVPEKVWPMYEGAFGALEAQQVRHLQIAEREAAEDPALADAILSAKGIFVTGGDQKRLMAIVGGTRAGHALREAWQERGACLAGTSAGASFVCTHMMAEGRAELAPEKGAAKLAPGMGFVPRVVIDQHFSQRHRINRLLSVVAQSPFLLGAGIDENTALIVHGDAGLEVAGEGCVTVVDCRDAHTNIIDIAPGSVPEMVDVRLHLLPAGSAFRADAASGANAGQLPADAKAAPQPLNDFIRYLTKDH